MSTNLTSTISASCFLAKLKKSSGVIAAPLNPWRGALVPLRSSGGDTRRGRPVWGEGAENNAERARSGHCDDRVGLFRRYDIFVARKPLRRFRGVVHNPPYPRS